MARYLLKKLQRYSTQKTLQSHHIDDENKLGKFCYIFAMQQLNQYVCKEIKYDKVGSAINTVSKHMSDLMLPSFPHFKKYSTIWTWWKKHKKRFKNLIYSEYQRKAEENFAIELYM